MRIIVISDIHLGTWGSKETSFVKALSEFSCDLLVLNGDIYDLHVSPPQFSIFDIIKNNKEIKNFCYILGNHDAQISNFYKDITVQDELVLFDHILITHGHQFDILSRKDINCPLVAKIRFYIESTFKFNLKTDVPSWVKNIYTWILSYTEKNAKKVNYPRVIIGHTHIPKLEDKYINCGAMTDNINTYLIIEKSEDIIKYDLKNI